MKSNEEVVKELAALFYYESASKEKGVSFEELEEENQKPFTSLAKATLANLGKMNLCVRPIVTENQEKVEALLHDRLETTVKSFFAELKVWKKGAIPENELIARIWQVWKSL